MFVDDDDFLKFNQELFFYNYKINYIDKANANSMKNKYSNIIYKSAHYDYEYNKHKTYKAMFDNIINKIANDKEHKIARIFCRIGDAVLCLVRLD